MHAPRRRTLHIALSLAMALAPSACQRKHIKVASVPQLPYPQCEGATADAAGRTEVLASGVLRPGATALEKEVLERWSLARRDCHYVATVRQEWPLATADVEVVFDEAWLPLRAWKRMTAPGSRRPDGDAEIKRYELRTPEVTITRRGSDGRREYEVLRGPRPRVVIGPGRGLLTAWLRRARLGVGQSVREPALDFRETVEIVRPVALKREADMFLPWLGRTARVYTIYGRETVFADEDDTVIGDLGGMRPDALAGTPRPAPVPMYGTPDPVHTP